MVWCSDCPYIFKTCQWLSLLALRRGWLWPKYQGRSGGPDAWIGNAAMRVHTHSGLNTMLFPLFTTCGWDRGTPGHVPSSIVLSWLRWAETDPVLHCSLLLLLVAIIRKRNWAKVMVWFFHLLEYCQHFHRVIYSCRLEKAFKINNGETIYANSVFFCCESSEYIEHTGQCISGK